LSFGGTGTPVLAPSARRIDGDYSRPHRRATPVD
jgi:hypothetical protein